MHKSNMIFITNEDIEYLNKKDIQLSLLKNLKAISDETILKDENKHILKEFLFSQFTENELSEIPDKHKNQIIEISLQVIKDKLETSIINREVNILRKINDFNEQEFLKIYSLKIETLKTQININKAETLELRKKADTISLNELANNINEYHNPNQPIIDIDKELDDLLNGGILNL